MVSFTFRIIKPRYLWVRMLSGTQNLYHLDDEEKSYCAAGNGTYITATP
jgi:hypothetical protein